MSSDDLLGIGPAEGRGIGFKRHLVAPALILLALEIGVIVVPLLSFFEPNLPGTSELLRVTLPFVFGAQLLWWGILGRWLYPLYRAISLRRSGHRLPRALAAKAYRSIWSLPIGALAVRTLLWAGVITGVGLVLHPGSGWSTVQLLELCALGGFHAMVPGILRAIWLHYLMRRFVRRLYPDIDPLRHFSAGYFRTLMLVSVSCVTLTLAAVAAFAYFFLPLTLDQYLLMQLYVPVAFAVTTGGVALHAFRARLYISDYLATFKEGGRGAAEKMASAVYKRVQSVPYRLLMTFWALWIGVAVVAVIMARGRWHLESDDAVLVFGVLVVVALGAGLYQTLWHREVMRPLLDHLTLQHRLPIRSMRTRLTLRSKLLLSFGGMVFFAVALALFWGFAQYKNLVTKYTANQADLGLAYVRSELQAAASEASEPPSRILVTTVLERLSSSVEDSSVVYYHLPRGGSSVGAYGGGLMGTPSLPWYSLAQIRRGRDAALALRAHSLIGRHGPLVLRWRGQNYDLGSVAIFYPSYRGRGSALVRPLRELLIFFLVLFGVCATIVVATVAQFVRPIRKLEERAEGMARGELLKPVSSGGESDEIGRLTFALEEMRRALLDKLRSTEEVNIDLERAVGRRTADLAKKNRELAETLEKLTRAQDQLLQSEKMASIGQLVAGIAHEINNPVNAIVNTVGPLGEAIGELESPDDQIRGEAKEDVVDMIRVVQRGAQRTKAIVQALHNYSRTDEESVVEIDLNRSLDDSLELLRHVFKQDVAIDRDYGEVGRVVGHAGQINQVFMNLLTNAGQAVSGKAESVVTIRTRNLDDDTVEVTIRDNGSGMTPQVRSRIFDPFFTTKDVGEGSGLGLSIVHGIIDRHSGRIEVDTEEGQGTEFRVYLPKGEGVPVSHGQAFDTLA